jgi:hypothetical protein
VIVRWSTNYRAISSKQFRCQLMKLRRLNLKALKQTALAAVCSTAACSFTMAAAHAATATWTTSNLDEFAYTNAVSPGSRALAPSVLGGVTYNTTTQQFETSTVESPARAGMALIAFNTTTNIAAGLDPSRYQINSVTFKATWTYDSDTNALFYRDTAVSQAELLAEAAANGYTRQKPLELYGVGLRAGYTGYEFGNGTAGPPLVDEITHPYTAPDGGYIAYPVVGSLSQPGTYVDVSNSVTGGYSATEPSHATAPFTPAPWAIGKANLAVGAAIPDSTTFTFTLDLNAAGVRSYLQQSLASGAVGLILSSLHSTGEFGSGGGYPRWYMKEAAGFPYFAPLASMPQLTIDYAILPAGLAGDYNGNGTVDAADYVLWRNGGPLQNEVDNPGVLNQQDYSEWRARFGANSMAGSRAKGGAAVPEPTTVSFTLGALASAFVTLGRTRGC